MPLIFKKIQEVIKKVGPFRQNLGQDSKMWLEDMEAETSFPGFVNLRKACIYEALNSAGKACWNDIPNI